MKNSRVVVLSIAVGALLWTNVACLAADGGAATKPVEAISKPSEDVTLSFDKPGLIAKIMVKEGDPVKAGQTIVQQDNGPEMAQLESLKADAEDDVKVRAAIEELAQKKVDLERMVEAKKKNVATDLDVDHARLDVTIAELSEELARFQHGQDGRKYQEAKLEMERMKITSPIDGKVQKIFQQAGEAPEAHARIIRVVKLDPLWVDVPMPISQAASTQVGRQAIINFPAYGKADPRPQTGKVIFIAPIEEAASQTVTVRVEVPNANQRRAGERVNVQFLDTMAPAGAPATTEQRILGTLPAVGPTHSSAAPKVAATVHVRSIGGNVAYDVDGSGECVSDPESLYSALVQRRTGGDDAVVIQVERDVEWKYAVEVFNQAVRAKYKNVGFAGSPDKAATALAAPIPTTMPTAADAPPCISPTATHPASGPPTTQAATTQPAATASTEPATESRKYIIKILQARVEAQQGIGLTWKPEHADSSTTAPTTAPAVGNK